ncbi:MAG: DoxX family protein [Bacteroidales bacterium]|nr:DoxX family protein [Bacteroidales bacterium]MDD2426032.1 DoxX family protein [Bacteroidales bacterium]MDD3990262.1 DoxX family protein [Bacteroidales bacterium]MDD4638815.1 DoxX family protein [Bacteroidales bacterium]
MKKLIKMSFDPGNYPVIISVSLLFLRIIAGSFMLTHGYGKFLMLTGDGPIQFADPIGIGVTASLVLAVLAEFICSMLLILGLATRYAVIPLLTTMLVAALIVHASDPFMNKELALLYATIFVFIGVTGAGKYSVDRYISEKIVL